MGARLKNFFEETGMLLLDIRENLMEWLITLAEVTIGNKGNARGERIMKAASHHGEIRLPIHLAEELCNGKKMRRVAVTLERNYNNVAQVTEEYLRIGKDFGNVAYSSYVRKLIQHHAKSINSSFDDLMNRIFGYATA